MKDRIKQIRKEVNLNQSDFAEKIGVKQSAVAGYESGNREPLDVVIKNICRNFSVNEDWLRNGIGEMHLPQNRNQRILSMVNDILQESDDSEKKQFFDMLTQLDARDWDTITKMFKIVKEQD